MEPTAIKHTVYRHCESFAAEKIRLLKEQLHELRESVMLDTKSTAGDKHETGRAHLQIAQEQVNQQLEKALSQQTALAQINYDRHLEAVANGSLVASDDQYYFVSIAAPKVLVDDQLIIPLSLESHLGSLLKGKKAGDSVLLNGKHLLIKKVL